MFCIVVLLALTYTPPRQSTAQHGAHPSLWLATANNLQRVGATDTAPSLTLPISSTSAVAVDRARAVVWAHANGQLRAFNLDGQARVNVAIATATGDTSFQPSQVTDLHISRDGTVWLTTLRRVYGFAPDGAFLRQITPPDTLAALALDDDHQRVWLGTGQTVAAYQFDGTPLTQFTVVGPAMKGLVYDPRLDQVWVALSNAVRRYDTAGNRVLETPVNGLSHIALASTQGLWLASANRVYRVDAAGQITLQM